MKEERLIGNSGILAIRQQCLDLLAEIREQAGILDDYFEVTDNPEYIAAWVDGDGKVVFGLRTDGKTFVGDADFLDDLKMIKVFLPLWSKVDWDALSIITLTDNPEFIDVETDSEGKVISYRDKDGVKHEKVGIETDKATINHLNLTGTGMAEFQQALKNSGFQPGGFGDWSDKTDLHIDEPYCAMVNFSGIQDIPQQKFLDVQGIMEFWDMNGNYFKKEVIMNAQGRSSLSLPKKNIAIDICNNNGWDSDDTFSLQIGDWVPQDSFHLKGFYMDPFRCVCPVTYQLYEEFLKTRGELNDFFWKRALLDLDEVTETSIGSNDPTDMYTNGAKGFPAGFPCIVYLNGEFYGIYSWQLKKHRDNYQMSKKKPKHIHLDGVIIDSTILAANGDSDLISWDATQEFTGFEIRNPKNIVCKASYTGRDGKKTWKYDADAPEPCPQLEPAGTDKNYVGDWAAGSYNIGEVVKHSSNYFINTVANNEAEPITDDGAGHVNSAAEPDFKNKTGCGWINCTNSVKVKDYILDLSRVMTRLSDAKAVYDASEKTAADVAAFKAVFETYFDVDNLVDYIITCDVLDNWDGFRGNWQWLTYDGVKWYIGIYDTDCVMGNNAWLVPGAETQINAPLTTHASSAYQYAYLLQFYTEELETRYAELRNAKLIDTAHIMSLVNNWIARYGGKTIFDLEWDKWPQFIKKDSVLRLYKWLNTSISNMDSLYNYNV